MKYLQSWWIFNCNVKLVFQRIYVSIATDITGVLSPKKRINHDTRGTKRSPGIVGRRVLRNQVGILFAKKQSLFLDQSFDSIHFSCWGLQCSGCRYQPSFRSRRGHPKPGILSTLIQEEPDHKTLVWKAPHCLPFAKASHVERLVFSNPGNEATYWCRSNKRKWVTLRIDCILALRCESRWTSINMLSTHERSSKYT